MNQFQRKWMKFCQILCFILVMLVCWIYWVSTGRNEELWKRKVQIEEAGESQKLKSSYEARKDLAMSSAIKTRDYSRCIYIDPLPKPTANTSQVTVLTTVTPKVNSSPPPPGEAPHRKGYYPEDLFTLEQRRHGWVLLHISGMIYMFFALAVVCEEFFVPALGIVTEKLHIPEELAGANFLISGGFAPEFFTSLIGIFLSHSNVGFGAIVGSGFFNILVVIGMCALFSEEMLSLNWWPLLRDVTFYTFDLLMLIVFFLDDIITWWESVLLLLGCLAYMVIMKYDELLEGTVKSFLQKHNNIAKVLAIDDPEELRPDVFRGGGSDYLRNCTSRNTIYQLIIHATNPFREGLVKRKTALKTVQVSNPAEPSKMRDEEQQSSDSETSGGSESEDEEDDEDDDSSSSQGDDSDASDDEDEDSENVNEPLSLKWPEWEHIHVPYVLLLPITVSLCFTLPDVRKQASKKHFVGTFLGSILWIGVFSYFMVCLAHRVSETVDVSEEAMGLTILSAGISLPNAITSAIVARRGLGGTAVSRSVGTNVFDITVGLSVPCLLYSIFTGGRAVSVSSSGLFCVIAVLFLILLSGVTSIAAFKWRINKTFGLIMLMLYLLFLFLSVLLV
ncbi:sodium/potassium/calcium exchanger 1-like [Myxocyprinus asiaticus]|uniref:sodium/potassium/calcium exchanger 1-like n=1 Tax=Myxocyprinus asiaticus TaxID=70543 RepID=UPI002223EC28|nr:sodium/potassium/calcium exchanger 1-like [Myxocyprinus asiaticus]XP_051570156.1 sodium/potassium/calcium exchanger 1-like [Myxocyprinus asiaticus]